jgi:hypothetical protein
MPKATDVVFSAWPASGDLEGIVAKWKAAPYRPDAFPPSWVSISNREYSDARDTNCSSYETENG